MAEPLRIDLDRSSPVPLYHQISTAIESRIDGGDLTAGAFLENEIALAARLGISRPKARRALQELVDKGKEACARFGEDIDHHLGRTLNKIDATVGRNGLRKLVAREMWRQRTGRKKAVPKRRTIPRSNVSKSKDKKGERGKHGLPGGRRAVVEEWEEV